MGIYLKKLGYKIKEENEIEIHKYTKEGDYLGITKDSSDDTFDYVYDCGKTIYKKGEKK